MVLRVGGKFYSLAFRHEDVQHGWLRIFCNYNRTTVATITEESGFRSWRATAHCSINDLWEPREGERLAFERAVSLAFRSRADRAAIWQQFLGGANVGQTPQQTECEDRSSALVSRGLDHPERQRRTSRGVGETAVGRSV